MFLVHCTRLINLIHVIFRDGRQLYEFLNKEHGVGIFSIFSIYLVTGTCI